MMEKHTHRVLLCIGINKAKQWDSEQEYDWEKKIKEDDDIGWLWMHRKGIENDEEKRANSVRRTSQEWRLSGQSKITNRYETNNNSLPFVVYVDTMVGMVLAVKIHP